MLHIHSRQVLPLVLLIAVALLSACALPGGGKSRTPAANVVPGIVLALPSNGNYAPIAQKIRQGASIAEQELRASGQSVSIINLSTDGPWLQKLAKLPASYGVVGGPLQEKPFAAAVAAGATSRRAFFTFMPVLKNAKEGVTAWRFFFSAEDQADAVMRCFSTLGVSSPAILYPADSFGSRMASLVESRLTAKGIVLKKVSYTPGDQNAMQAAVKTLLSGQERMDAVFFPDSWRSMSSLAEILEKEGAHDVIEVGSMMWDGYLNGRPLPTAAKYPLAVFPSSFVREMAPAALPAGADAWTALGYDFVKFASRMAVTGTLPREQLVSRARHAALMNFAMAPISYDSNGKAAQRLFLLQPGLQGAILMNRSALLQTRDALKSRAADDPGLSESASGSFEYPYAVPPGSSAETGTAQAAPLPASRPGPSGQPAASKPAHTSYKLRVPGAR